MDTRRDFVFVSDLVGVALKAVEGVGRSGVYHVSSGSDVSIKDLYDATILALGSGPTETSRCARAIRTTRRPSCSTPR